MPGIEKTLEVFQDISKLMVSAVHIYQRGVGVQTLSDMWKVADSIKELVVDLPPAMPEIRDLDGQEAARLGAAAHQMLTEIAEAFAA